MPNDGGSNDGGSNKGVSPPVLGVVYDVDGALQIAHGARQLGRVWALLRRSPHDRRSVLGMPRLLRSVAEAAPGTRVFYLTAVPSRFVRILTRFLHRDGYPPGTPLMSDSALVSGWLLGFGLASKRAALARLADEHPQLRWVLIGDDAGHDPQLFSEFARHHRDRVALVALRQVLEAPNGESHGQMPGVAVVAAPNGEELLPQVAAGLKLGQPRSPAVDDWFLSESERGNDATRLRPWTTGNAACTLVHGRTYLSAVADALSGTERGDTVLFAGWRADSDELLTDTGPTVGEALAGAARRGVLVRGLLWRSHLSIFGYHAKQNRTLAAEVGAAGGQVLLDQRIRPLGSHHQKLVVVRHAQRPRSDIAFVGGIDLDRGSRDDADHRGDPQPAGSDEEYGPTPARQDVQVALQGPAVREVEDVFRERWEDPARLVRLPWHVVADRVHGMPKSATPLPPPAPDPPDAGNCAVQILRTYPRRRPPHPFAPEGERSVARAYAKALSRARRLIYVEDQYLWSVDVARIFAAALRRSPQLHLIAVVPRRIDQKVAAREAELGQHEAIAMVCEAGGDRVQIFDIENHQDRPIYVHTKVCIVDDVWALVGSNNLNNRSWTYDSELAAAILDDDRDLREPADPAGLGDGARRFARRLRLDLMREHLDYDGVTEADLLDPDHAAQTVRRQAAALDDWHARGQHGTRPPGRLRSHARGQHRAKLPRLTRWVAVPGYRMVLDPDGRPLGMRLRRSY